MAAQAEPSLILSFEEARHLVEEHAARLHPQGKELVDLLDSAGLVIAEPISADRDFPPFPRAARDGYALRAADLAELPAMLAVVGEIKAGALPEAMPEIHAGEAAVIMTGAPAPIGANAIVMVEYTSRAGDRVEIAKGVSAGDNIVPAGSEAKRGERVLAPGVRLDHSSIAVAASVGRTHLLVHRKPQIAVLATGDEVVDADVLPGPNQIRNSNSYSLAAQIREAGGEAVILPIAPDEPERLRELIADGLESDLLLLAGGVSAGKYDFVEQVLREFQAEFFCTGARIQPGRPVVFGRVPRGATDPAFGREDRGETLHDAGATGISAPETFRYFFGLPGNPISTMVTFELFARPMLEALCGMTPRKLVFLHAKLKSEIKTRTGLKRFLPAELSGEFEHAEVELVRWQGSGDIAAAARANCYVVIPPDRERIAAGEWVPVLLR
jgi:molybdopterin molybdotransferase